MNVQYGHRAISLRTCILMNKKIKMFIVLSVSYTLRANEIFRLFFFFLFSPSNMLAIVLMESARRDEACRA